MELVRLPDEKGWRREAEEITQAHRKRLAAGPRPRDQRRYAVTEQGYTDVMAGLPYDTAATPIFASPHD
ncbi:hypothetical protein [Streptomyces gobitricini]|uniref:Uncharacterized protein n=1 Tax=Streptomyces gobitricini TaxID=68211 RepID=A0ABP5ZV62_9ACTN